MAVVNDTHRYLFLAEEHTASRAIRDALLDQHVGSRVIGQHHASLRELENKGYIHDSWQYHSFCTIRNPADIMVTRWLTGPYSTIPFSLYLRGTIEEAANRARIFFKHAHSVTTVLRYETLDGDLDKLMPFFGASLLILPVVGVTANKSTWWTYYRHTDLTYMMENCVEAIKFGYADVLKWHRDLNPRIKS